MRFVLWTTLVLSVTSLVSMITIIVMALRTSVDVESAGVVSDAIHSESENPP